MSPIKPTYYLILKKLKNIELKKKLAKAKSKIDQEDIDKSSLFKQTIEQQKRLEKSQSDYKNKEITSITQDVFIQKVQGVTNKFETVARDLNFISTENTNGNILLFNIEVIKL